jgi:sigma-B regulation protein RsbU (phosphoserine phosphatase)
MSNTAFRKSIIEQAKILIVDNAKTSRVLLMEHCKKVGFVHIEEASDGMQALDKIIAWKPDLVFMGMYMPQLTGLQICQELQSKGLTGDMAIIMLTSMNSPEFKEKAFDAGIVDFITKPLNDKELFARTMMHLDHLFMHRKLEFNYSEIQTELKDSAVLQRVLLPDELILDELRSSTGLDIDYYYQPATDLSGDFVSVKRLSEHKILLALVDVSAHGITAGLYAFAIHILLNEHSIHEQNPSKLLGILNEKLNDLMPNGINATLFLGMLDLEEKRLDYAAAGSPKPILFSKTKTTIIDTTGPLFGVEKDVNFTTHTVPFEQGDKFFLYSNALIQSANSVGKCISEDELVQLLVANEAKKSHSINKSVITYLFTNCSQSLSGDLVLMVVSG